MDKTDVILCQLLLMNSRLSYRRLADMLNLSVAAVHSRIQSLIVAGVIARISVHKMVKNGFKSVFPYLGLLWTPLMSVS